jgi:hypothetical protein
MNLNKAQETSMDIIDVSWVVDKFFILSFISFSTN